MAQTIIVNCQNCGIGTEKSVGRYNESVKNKWNFFCSKICRYAFKEKGEIFDCSWCKKKIIKTPGQKRQVKTNLFCSKSCAAKYNNRNKSFGIRRSKLELFLEDKIKEFFPDLNFTCNSIEAVGMELDFYFQNLRLAIEVNGFLHFKPVYGREKLLSIQKNDAEKVKKCEEMKIRLIIIDVSDEPHLTQPIKENHWKTVKHLIELSQKNDAS